MRFWQVLKQAQESAFLTHSLPQIFLTIEKTLPWGTGFLDSLSRLNRRNHRPISVPRRALSCTMFHNAVIPMLTCISYRGEKKNLDTVFLGDSEKNPLSKEQVGSSFFAVETNTQVKKAGFLVWRSQILRHSRVCERYHTVLGCAPTKWNIFTWLGLSTLLNCQQSLLDKGRVCLQLKILFQI